MCKWVLAEALDDALDDLDELWDWGLFCKASQCVLVVVWVSIFAASADRGVVPACLEGSPDPILDECSYSLVEPVMETTLISSCDGVSGVIGVNVFAGFARAAGFLCIASHGDGWLKSDVISVGPWLLVCLPMGTTVWCVAGANWLTGLTDVHFLMVVACWISSSVDGLWSDVLRLGSALSILIPDKTCDTVDSVDFLSAVLEGVRLVPVCQ